MRTVDVAATACGGTHAQTQEVVTAGSMVVTQICCEEQHNDRRP